tara:strand:+ start:4693 stop:6270 length:1578 start_codon:yes stop_codon:yes gene_type:complete
MAAIIELKYFNTFWLKKIQDITRVAGLDLALQPPILLVNANGTEITVNVGLTEIRMNVGVEVTMVYNIGGTDIKYSGYIVSRAPGNTQTVFNVAVAPIGPVPANTEIFLGKIVNFDNIPQAYTGDLDTDWIIEESRIRGGYNNTSVDFGVKAYAVDEEPAQSHKFSTLIHSGIFNSRTGINQTNQFSVAEDITRTIDPANGSIQKLYAEDTNLIIFQESKVSKSLIDKDAIYSAEGNASVTSRNLVIGQNVAYAGEYGISTDPESFAVNGYRKYFTDRDQNVVLRLSMDGITPISDYGMTDFFRDKLSLAADNIIGGWDAHNKQYVLTIPGSPIAFDNYETVAFDETSKGWVSRFDYNPNQIFSLNNNYFTAYKGAIWKHYTLAPNTQARSVFYEVQKDSRVTFVFNAGPSSVKNFQTINYEGDNGWVMSSFKTNTDSAFPISQATFSTSLTQMQDALLINNFKLKEDKYYADLVNATPSQRGEVVFGRSSSGVKGFFGEVTMTVDNSSGKKELFAVSTGFVISS